METEIHNMSVSEYNTITLKVRYEKKKKTARVHVHKYGNRDT